VAASDVPANDNGTIRNPTNLNYQQGVCSMQHGNCGCPRTAHSLFVDKHNMASNNKDDAHVCSQRYAGFDKSPANLLQAIDAMS
jgi:hypothetical protein